MSDYPMLISNKLHSFRNFSLQKYGKKPTFAFNHILNNNRIMKKAVLAVYSYCLFMVLISCLIFLFRMAGHSGVKPFNRSSL